MAHFEQSKEYPTFALVFSTIMLFLFIILFIWHAYAEWKMRQYNEVKGQIKVSGGPDMSERNIAIQRTKWVTFAVLFADLLWNAVYLINQIRQGPVITCIGYAVILQLFFILGRVFLWTSFILRIKNVYGGTTFAVVSNWPFTIIYILIVIWVSLAVLVGAMIANDIHINEERNNCDYVLTSHGQQILFIMLLINLVIELICCYLFMKPLKRMLNHTKEAQMPKQEHVLSNLMVKYSIMVMFTIVMLLATFILVYSTNGFLFIVVNYWSDSLAVVLMSKSHQTAYQFLCCGCHQCAESILLKSEPRSMEEVESM